MAARVNVIGDTKMRSAVPSRRSGRKKMGFVPNDPYFHKETPAGWTGPGQWHLINEYAAGRDVRVQGAWARNIIGAGVIIGIVDDCLETAHPDLAPNYVAADSWDFYDNDADPNPVYSDDYHGISVAGVAAARGGNGAGVTGAAPYAGLAGLRMDFTTEQCADATLYHSSGANTSIKIKNHSYAESEPFIAYPLEKSALATSAAAGTIHCFAAGNERLDPGEDTNKKDPQNSPDAISVAALGSDGTYADYSCFGACVFVTAPSSSSGYYRITTTDRTGESRGYNGADDTFPDANYTSTFGGTSATSSLAAGVLALAKQVQPNLDTRFAKHLLARTSAVVDPNDSTPTSDGGWKTNAAGLKFNQNYGFGLIDANNLTQQAVLYSGVTALSTESTGTVSVGAAIPDDDANGVSRTFTLSSTTPLEEMLVTLDVTHTWRGDLEGYLTSPQGTRSRLFYRSSDDDGNDIKNWTFADNAFWGENPSGIWTLMVSDVDALVAGTWSSYSVTARMGQLAAAPKWNVDANGSWSNSANWSGSVVPNGKDKAAVLGSVATASRMVTLDIPVTLSVLTFDANGNYTIAGSQTLTFDGNSGAALNVSNVGGNGAHRIATPIAVNVPLTITQASTGSLSLTNNIGGSGALRIAGGTVIVAGNNTYSGGTTIYTGVLSVSDPTNLGTGAVTFDGGALQVTGSSQMTISRSMILKSGGGTFDITNAAGVSFSGLISGTGDLVKTGSGGVSFSAANTYSGTTTIKAGTLSLEANAPAGAPGSLGNAASPVLVGDANGTASAGLLIASPNVTVGRAITVRAGSTGTMTLGGSHTAGVSTFSAGVTLNKDTTLTAASGGTVQFAGAITGAGAVTKSGAGTIVLSATNSYAGNTTISGGALRATYGTGWPTGTHAILSGGVLELTSDFTGSLGTGAGNVDMTYGGGFAAFGGARTVNLGGTGAQVAWDGGSFVATGSTLYFGSLTADANVVFANPISLGSPLYAATRYVQVNDNDASPADCAEIAGVISAGNSNAGLRKTGTGTLILSNANTYPGTTTLSAGTLVIARDSNTGSGPVGTGTLSLGAATIRPDSADRTLSNTFSLAGSTTFGTTDGNALTFTGTGSLTATQTLTVNNTTRFLNRISGPGYGIYKDGPGTLVLAGANTYTGTSRLFNGTLVVANDSNTGNGPVGTGTLYLSGGTIQPDSTDRTLTNAVTLASTTAFGVASGNSLTFKGAATLSGTSTLTVNNTTRFAGAISDGGSAYGTIKTGPGTLIFGDGNADASANTYTGGTTVSAGTLVLNKKDGTNAFGGSLTVNGGTARLNEGNQIPNGATVTVSSGTLDFNGRSDTIGKLTYQGGAVTNVAGTLALTSTSTALTMRNTTINFDVALTGASGGTVAFEATSNGTAGISGRLNLGGATRAFNIADGTAAVDMQVTGAISGAGGLTKIGSGALLLGGANTYAATTTLTSGTLIVASDSNAAAGSGPVGTASLSLGSATIQPDANDRVLANTITLAGNTTFGVASGSALTFTGPATLSGTWTLTVRNSTVFTGVISGAGCGIAKDGAGTLTLGGGPADTSANTYTSVTTVSAGTLVLNKGPGTNAVGGNLTISGGTVRLAAPEQIPDGNAVTLSSGSLDLNSQDETIRSLSGSDGNVLLGSATLQLGYASSSFGGRISGTGGLTKVGTGVFTVSGTNTYTGPTTIQGGTLVVGGGSTASKAFALASNTGIGFGGGTHGLGGATFTNAGTIEFNGAAVNFDSNTVIPGRVWLSSGTIGGSATATFTGTLNWTGGTMTGSGVTEIPAEANLVIGGGGNKYLARALTNYGTTALADTGPLYSNSGGGAVAFNNQPGATFDVQGDAAIGCWSTNPATFNNAGVFTKSAGTGTTTVGAYWTFNNTGVVEVRSGGASLGGPVAQLPGTTLTGGIWIVDANSTLALTSASNITVNQGSVTLDGPGSIFARINTLADNDGNFSILNGRDFTTSGALENSGTLTVGLGSTLTVSGPLTWTGGNIEGDGTINANNGASITASVAKSGAGTLNLGGAQEHGSGSTLAVLAGAVNLNTDAGGADPNEHYHLTINASGTGTEVRFGATQHLAGLNLTAGANAQLLADGTRVLATRALLIDANNAQLDLIDNDLIVRYGVQNPTSDIAAWIKSGFNDYAWSGSGITSSAAANDPNQRTALGVMNNSLYGYGDWSGQTGLDGNEVLVKFTWYGDADLNGEVNYDDYLQWEGGLGGSGTGWLYGDFDYNGEVNYDDYLMWEGALGGQTGILSDGPTGLAADDAAVPEPATALLVGVGAICLAMRRRWA